MAPPDHTAQDTIGRLASRAHGVVTRQELLRAGLSQDQVRDRVRCGALLVEYRGVYRAGHRARSLEARYLAAVRAAGPGALLCGHAAAFLFGALRGATAPPPEVLTTRQRRLPGVRIHRTGRIDRREATTYRGIPAAILPRTLVDLAATMPARALAVACHEAQVRHRITPAQVERELVRHPNRPGAGTLRQVLNGDTPVLLSRLETRFRQRLSRARLPMPVTNRPAGAYYVDCRWPRHRLTVELDSYRYHHTRHAWEQDHRREREARGRGERFRRYTWDDVAERPGPMIDELRALLT